jgi:hypothetical protein
METAVVFTTLNSKRKYLRATLHLQNYDQLSFSLPKGGVNMYEYNNLREKQDE